MSNKCLCPVKKDLMRRRLKVFVIAAFFIICSIYIYAQEEKKTEDKEKFNNLTTRQIRNKAMEGSKASENEVDKEKIDKLISEGKKNLIESRKEPTIQKGVENYEELIKRQDMDLWERQHNAMKATNDYSMVHELEKRSMGEIALDSLTDYDAVAKKVAYVKDYDACAKEVGKITHTSEVVMKENLEAAEKIRELSEKLFNATLNKYEKKSPK